MPINKMETYRRFWLAGSSVGSTPTAAVLLLALLALMIVKYFVVSLAMPSTAAKSVKKGKNMQNQRKLVFTSVLETIHGLGVSGWVGYLLSKIASCFGTTFNLSSLTLSSKGR